MAQQLLMPLLRPQRGAVAIMFGLSLIVLIGFAGLVIDLGRFFVIKAELQNAVDACALSAASQLRPGRNDSHALERAVAYGRVFSTGGVPTAELPDYPKNEIKNRVNFQSTMANIGSSHISFSSVLTDMAADGSSNYLNEGAANPNTARYAKCEYPLSELPIFFMRVLNLMGAKYSTQTVSALAAASRGPEVCNVIPVAICEKDTSASHGLLKGQWLNWREDTALTGGDFGWVSFSKGGADEVRDRLMSAGECHVPALGDPVELETGRKTSAELGWNTRLGIYPKNDHDYNLVSAPPDKTGFSYYNVAVGTTAANWPRTDLVTTPRAYDETHPLAPTLPNFQTASIGTLPYAQTTELFTPEPTRTTLEQHDKDGRADRRLVIAPIMNCATRKFTGDNACGLMLNPFGKVASDRIDGKLEYLGPSTSPPCGTGGATGPLMSVLVK